MHVPIRPLVLMVFLRNMLDDVDSKAGFRGHQNGPGGRRHDSVASRESVRCEHLTGLIQIIHVHANDHHILFQHFDRCDVHMTAAGVPHARCVDVIADTTDLVMAFLETHRLKKCDGSVCVPSDDQRIKRGNFN